MGGGSSFQVVETTMKYAVIVVSTLPIVMIYPFVQKYFVVCFLFFSFSIIFANE